MNEDGAESAVAAATAAGGEDSGSADVPTFQVIVLVSCISRLIFNLGTCLAGKVAIRHSKSLDKGQRYRIRRIV